MICAPWHVCRMCSASIGSHEYTEPPSKELLAAERRHYLGHLKELIGILGPETVSDSLRRATRQRRLAP